MKSLVVFLAAIVATSATAGVIGYAQSQEGRLELHDGHGVCVFPALYAEWRPTTGDVVRGCWLIGGGAVRVVFLDGDVVMLPVGAFKKPRPT